MAENLLLDLAITVMVDTYNLDENEYAMFKFSEGSKSVTLGMTNGEVPITVTFPRDFLRFEEMKRWSDEKKTLYVRHQIENGLDIPEELAEAFHYIVMQVELPPVEKQEEVQAVPEEETAEEFVEKTEGKKKVKKLSKKKSA